MLKVEDINVYYGAIHAIKGISLEVPDGEIVALIGSNGAGKSTTLRTISGLMKPKTGKILYEGQDIAGMAAHKIVGLGLCQVPEGRHVFANMTVLENLELGAYLRKDKDGIAKDMLLSIIITTLAVFLPLFDSFMPTKESQLWLMYISFSLLGIGNAIMQTSINPLVTMLVKGHLASTLTFGQFVKAIASFIAPLIAAWGATTTAPIFGLSWRILFLLFFVVGMIATLWLGMTSIEEEPIEGKASGFVDCLKMLGSPIILLSFIGIMCHVGIDVGTNAVAPKILLERLGGAGDTLSQFEYATSVYFAFRTLGCFTGSILMRKLNIRTFDPCDGAFCGTGRRADGLFRKHQMAQ